MFPNICFCNNNFGNISFILTKVTQFSFQYSDEMTELSGYFVNLSEIFFNYIPSPLPQCFNSFSPIYPSSYYSKRKKNKNVCVALVLGKF